MPRGPRNVPRNGTRQHPHGGPANNPVGTPRLLTGWGRTAPSVAAVVRPRSAAEVAEVLADPDSARGLIARGLGRAYGDAAQAAGGVVLDCTGLAPSVDIDADSGIVRASGGVSLDRLLRDVVPLGWFLPATPGTRQVTVGGAVAADVHGKNQHVDGSFGDHLLDLTIALPGGEIVTVEPDDPLFAATVGGMGLTGVVTQARWRCLPVRTSAMVVDAERVPDLDAALTAMAAPASRRYAVAWIDLLATGSKLGRSILGYADHAAPDELAGRAAESPLEYAPRTRLTAPRWVPPGLLNQLTVRAFNEAWFRAAPATRRTRVQPAAAYFHPLDGVRGWNRLYGPHGLVQYQLVVPYGAEDTLRWVVRSLAEAAVPSFLAVLKCFGRAGVGPLSFPTPGWALSLDVPASDARLPHLLRTFDEQVAEVGGRIYLAKDSTLRADLLPAMYPRLAEFQAVRAEVDPHGLLCSDLARRLGL